MFKILINIIMATATASATYSATSSGTGSGSGNTETEAISAANSAALTAAQNAITTVPNTFVSNTSLLLLEKININKGTTSTFNYYWDLYPDLFGKIQIIDTTIDKGTGQILTDNDKIIENNIAYLNEYYNKGYRLFIGFSRSTILKGILPWFTTIGTKAKGISLSSSASSLNFPKPIYRLQPDDLNLLYSIEDKLQSSSKIYYFYSGNEESSLSILNFLMNNYEDKLKIYPVFSNEIDLTEDKVQNFYKGADNNSITVLNLVVNANRNYFLQLFTKDYPLPNSTYDTGGFAVPDIKIINVGIVNKYNHLNYISFSTSKLFRDGYNDLIKTAFVTQIPNALLLINKLAVDGDVTTLPSHNSILEFNENNDLKYYTILSSVCSKNSNGEYFYKPDFYSVSDPIVGNQIFYVNNQNL